MKFIYYPCIFCCLLYSIEAATFTSGIVISSNADHVYAVDIDGDGDIDVLSSKFAWYENDGNTYPEFTEHVISDGQSSIYAVDIDGDGDMDLLSSKIAWYENDGNTDPVFTEHVISGSVNHVYAADIDGDGDIDLLSATGNLLAWYENDGNQVFTKHVIDEVSTSLYDLYAADVDGDGTMDILCGMDDELSWYKYDGNQVFTKHVIEIADEIYMSVHATDVDSDGDMDVLAVQEQYAISWYPNNGNQEFGVSSICSDDYCLELDGDDGGQDCSCFRPIVVYAADLDKDGDIDVLTGSRYYMTWWENDGNQQFTEYKIMNSNPSDVYAADVDGDGLMDLLSASPFAWYRQCPVHSYVSGVTCVCEAGYYGQNGNQAPCTICPEGAYEVSPGMENCKCNVGYYGPNGSAPCTACPKNSSQASEGMDHCTCDAGYYSPNGQAPCTLCPWPFSASEGSNYIRCTSFVYIMNGVPLSPFIGLALMSFLVNAFFIYTGKIHWKLSVCIIFSSIDYLSDVSYLLFTVMYTSLFLFGLLFFLIPFGYFVFFAIPKTSADSKEWKRFFKYDHRDTILEHLFYTVNDNGIPQFGGYNLFPLDKPIDLFTIKDGNPHVGNYNLFPLDRSNLFYFFMYILLWSALCVVCLAWVLLFVLLWIMTCMYTIIASCIFFVYYFPYILVHGFYHGMVLFLGFYLYQCKLLQHDSVIDVWCPLLYQDYCANKEKASIEGIHIGMFNRAVISEVFLESIPQLIVQTINNVLTDQFSIISLFSVISASVMILSTIYRYAYYWIWHCIPLNEIPIMSKPDVSSAKRDVEIGSTIYNWILNGIPLYLNESSNSSKPVVSPAKSQRSSDVEIGSLQPHTAKQSEPTDPEVLAEASCSPKDAIPCDISAVSVNAIPVTSNPLNDSRSCSDMPEAVVMQSNSTSDLSLEYCKQYLRDNFDIEETSFSKVIAAAIAALDDDTVTENCASKKSVIEKARYLVVEVCGHKKG